MALISCKECGKDISDKALTCPHCGAPTKYAQQKEDDNFQWFQGFMLVLLIGTVVGVIGYEPYCSSKAGIEYKYQIGHPKGMNQTPRVIKKPWLIFFKCK